MLSLFRRPFYGWWMVAGAVICQFASMGTSQAVVGVFLKPVVDDLGWQVWQFTLGSSLAAGAGAVSGIIAGNVVDRRGPRPLILVGAIVASLCFVGLSRQSNLFVFLVLYTISGLIGWNLFGPLVINATITKWFVRKRGWALAIGSIGISLAGLIAPVSTTFIVDTWDWRVGYVALAVFVLVVVIPMAFVMRRTPEDHGLLPDGEVEVKPRNELGGDVAKLVDASLTRAEAIRTRGFWLLTLGFGLNQAALGSVLVHAIPFATDVGFSRAIAAAGLAVNGLGNLSSKAVWGYGLQRFQPRLLVLAAYSISSTGVALMLVAAATGQQAILFPGFFLYGFGFGGTIPLSEFIWAKYFGRRHIGAIRGIGNPVMILLSGVGPILVGLWFDLSGSYQLAFVAIIVAYMTGALSVNISREPLKMTEQNRV